MADNAPKRPGDAVDLNEEASPREKKMRASINDVVADLRCPITLQLPFDPVTAQDGKIYEREAILEWFRNKDGEATSPSTGKVIGTDAPRVGQRWGLVAPRGKLVFNLEYSHPSPSSTRR